MQSRIYLDAIGMFLRQTKHQLHDELLRGVALQVVDEDGWDGTDYVFARRIGSNDDDDSIPELEVPEYIVHDDFAQNRQYHGRSPLDDLLSTSFFGKPGISYSAARVILSKRVDVGR